MILLNEHGKQAATTGEGRKIWSLSSYDPNELYWIEEATLPDGNGVHRHPVKSVGKKAGQLSYQFAADLRFINYHGHECVFPVGPLELELEVFPSGGGFKARVHHQNWPIFTTPQFMPTEQDAVNGVARWAAQGDKSRWIMPAEVRHAVEAMGKKVVA